MKLYKSYLADPSDNINESEDFLTEEILPELFVECLVESDELTEMFLDYLQEADADKKETKKEKFKRYLKMAGKAALVGAAGVGAYHMAKGGYKKGLEKSPKMASMDATARAKIAAGKAAVGTKVAAGKAAVKKAAAPVTKMVGDYKSAGQKKFAAYQRAKGPHAVKAPLRPTGKADKTAKKERKAATKKAFGYMGV